jgi:hypothetical protein
MQKLKATFKCPSFADTEYWSDAYLEIAQNCGLAVTTEVLEYEPQMFAGTLRKVHQISSYMLKAHNRPSLC